jgi:hypothetical protein
MGAIMTYTDLLFQIQQDCTDKLNSESAFQYIAVLSYRKAVIATEISKRMPHLAGKNGKVGCGILVMMPLIEGADPNVATPQGDLLLPFHVIAEPEINETPGGNGTGITAEQVALTVRAFIHQLGLRGQVALYQDQRAIEPLIGLEKDYPNCIGYQVMLRGKMSDVVIPQCATPMLSEGPALTITLSTTDSGATIYYTTDGSYPGSGNSTGVAHLYAAPFTVTAGTVVAFASYKPGCRGSDVEQYTINS